MNFARPSTDYILTGQEAHIVVWEENVVDAQDVAELAVCADLLVVLLVVAGGTLADADGVEALLEWLGRRVRGFDQDAGQNLLVHLLKCLYKST